MHEAAHHWSGEDTRRLTIGHSDDADTLPVTVPLFILPVVVAQKKIVTSIRQSNRIPVVQHTLLWYRFVQWCSGAPVAATRRTAKVHRTAEQRTARSGSPAHPPHPPNPSSQPTAEIGRAHV